MKKLKDQIHVINQWVEALFVYTVIYYCTFGLICLGLQLLATPEFRKHPIAFSKKAIHDAYLRWKTILTRIGKNLGRYVSTGETPDKVKEETP